MIEVKQATLKDLKELANLFDQYRVFYLQESDLAAAKNFIEERLAKKQSVLFVAKEGKTAVGFTQLYPSFSSVSMRPLWVLNDLFVRLESRKKGVAEKLIHSAEAFAKRSGAIGLTLKTARDNEAAQKLYEKLGWKRDEQFVSYNLRYKK